MSDAGMADRIGFFVVLLLSLTVHEWAHAISAFKLGDDTASRMGRLTLNPISHIDPIGTVLLPLLGVPFGWAKPVPVNPAGFRRGVSMARGMAITASAGPISNIVLALLCAVGIRIVVGSAPELWASEKALRVLLGTGMQINVVLAVFNLLPLPPLDGSRIVDAAIPYKLRPQWERFAQFGPIILIAMLVLPSLGFPAVSAPLHWAIGSMTDLVFTVVTIGL